MVSSLRFLALFVTVGLLSAACATPAPTAVPVTSTPAIRLPTLAPTPIPPATVSASPTALRVGPKRGNIAPDFTLPNLDGEPVSLYDFRGQVVLINFWASWCGPCLAELPAIEAQYQSTGDLVVLASTFRKTWKPSERLWGNSRSPFPFCSMRAARW